MKTLMILRPEIFSIIIMLYLVIYDQYCSQFRTEKNYYHKFALACLGHCIFALITEITVNMNTIPAWFNDLCHILFFLCSVLYSLFYFEYALSLILPNSKNRKRILAMCYILSAISIIIMIISPINYIHGKYTSYSAGTGPTACYVLGFLMFLAADAIIIIKRKRVSNTIIAVLIPISFITIALLIFQIMVPEFLFTAQSLTITAVGLFFALENPVEKFTNKAFVDFNVQIWNRNCYEHDVTTVIPHKIKAGSKISCVIGDVNGLKSVNDKLGHMKGDKLLETVAMIWNTKLKSAYRSYRIGGDEFFALYFDAPLDLIKNEAMAASVNCNGITMGENLPVGISIGFAELDENGDINEMFRTAETMMYESKKEYYTENNLERRKE